MASVTLPKYSWLNMTNLLQFNGYTFWDNTTFPDSIPYADADKYIQLSDIQAKRIDLVSFQQYGDPNLGWVLMIANDKDLPNDFLGGELIRIPSKNTIDTLLSSKT